MENLKSENIKILLWRKKTDLIQTKFEHEESVFNIESHTKYTDACNSMYGKTKTFVNTVPMNSDIGMGNVSDSNLFQRIMDVYVNAAMVTLFKGVHLEMTNFMGTRCIYVKLVIEISRTNLCVCHVVEELQRKCVKFTRKMNMILDNLLFCSVLGTVFMKLGVHIFACHVTLHLQRLILQIQLSHIM